MHVYKFQAVRRLLVLAVVLSVFTAGCTSVTQWLRPNQDAAVPAVTSMEKNNTTAPQNQNNAAQNTGDGADTAAGFTGTVLAGSSAPLLDFNRADYDTALASRNVLFLYFYATWCPICIAEVPSLYGAFNSLTTDQVVGFRVNFNDSDTDDEETALAREHGVAYQHTKVAIKGGMRVLKSPETWNQQRYRDEIAALLQ